MVLHNSGVPPKVLSLSGTEPATDNTTLPSIIRISSCAKFLALISTSEVVICSAEQHRIVLGRTALAKIDQTATANKNTKRKVLSAAWRAGDAINRSDVRYQNSPRNWTMEGWQVSSSSASRAAASLVVTCNDAVFFVNVTLPDNKPSNPADQPECQYPTSLPLPEWAVPLLGPRQVEQETFLAQNQTMEVTVESVIDFSNADDFGQVVSMQCFSQIALTVFGVRGASTIDKTHDADIGVIFTDSGWAAGFTFTGQLVFKRNFLRLSPPPTAAATSATSRNGLGVTSMMLQPWKRSIGVVKTGTNTRSAVEDRLVMAVAFTDGTAHMMFMCRDGDTNVPNKAKAPPPCAHCGKPARLGCPCGQVAYYSEACQRAHWAKHRPAHQAWEERRKEENSSAAASAACSLAPPERAGPLRY